jgi:hypothetical protein
MPLARLLVTLCFAFCAAAAARADNAGQVLSAAGEAHALRGGRILQLYPGAPVESGDLIHTGADSYVQIRFTDWSLISLRPRTDFIVDEYAYEANRGGSERAFFILIRGGIRSLTGLIGHRNRANYHLSTTTSTIGIRGTHYSVLICKQDCRNADGSLGPDGLYGGVLEGRIAVTPYGGDALEREFGAGEYFRLDNENAVPARLFAPPAFFWDPQAQLESRTFAGVLWRDEIPLVTGATADLLGTAGSLLRTGDSLVLSPITAPVLSQVSPVLGQTVALAGSTLSPVIASLSPIVAPVASIAPPTPIAAVATPPVSAVTLPTVPSLPGITTTLPSLLPKK